MRANTRYIADDGYEICEFPFEYLYMSQDEGGDYSHVNTYNIDFLGWGANGRIYNCPFYAPVTLECVEVSSASDNNRIYQSINKVHLADGSLDYLTIAFAHDNTPIHNVGDIIFQGELLGHTGTAGYVTGDHTHSCCGKGLYQGYTEREGGHWDLTNRVHYWLATYVNDTVIVNGFNHNWIEYSNIPPTPPDPAGYILKGKFPFVLYANKLRKLREKAQNK